MKNHGAIAATTGSIKLSRPPRCDRLSNMFEVSPVFRGNGTAAPLGRMLMVLPQQVRAEKLRALRSDQTKAVGTEKVFYKNRPERFHVFQIPLELLIYNRHNGR